jgi:hypothetical protein
MLVIGSMARAGGAALLGMSLLFTGCVEPPGAERIVGPDGTQMLHVHCADEQVACFQLAGERCPHGYDLSPIFDPHDGNFLVRCKDPQASGAFATRATAPSARASSSSSPAADDRWPPVEVARPSEPWPVSSSGAAPSPNAASSTVDIGY